MCCLNHWEEIPERLSLLPVHPALTMSRRRCQPCVLAFGMLSLCLLVCCFLPFLLVGGSVLYIICVLISFSHFSLSLLYLSLLSLSLCSFLLCYFVSLTITTHRAKSIKNKPRINREVSVAELKLLLAKQEKETERWMERAQLLTDELELLRKSGGTKRKSKFTFFCKNHDFRPPVEFSNFTMFLSLMTCLSVCLSV